MDCHLTAGTKDPLNRKYSSHRFDSPFYLISRELSYLNKTRSTDKLSEIINIFESKYFSDKNSVVQIDHIIIDYQ